MIGWWSSGWEFEGVVKVGGGQYDNCTCGRLFPSEIAARLKLTSCAGGTWDAATTFHFSSSSFHFFSLWGNIWKHTVEKCSNWPVVQGALGQARDASNHFSLFVRSSSSSSYRPHGGEKLNNLRTNFKSVSPDWSRDAKTIWKAQICKVGTSKRSFY